MRGRRLQTVIYSQDSLGLGHLRRTTLIGAELLSACPESDVLLITDSPVAPFFELPDGMDHLKVPSIRKVDAGQWQPTRLHLETRQILDWRSRLLQEIFVSCRPDLVLVDHMPGGALGELLPALRSIKRLRPDSAIVFGAREILDDETVIRRVWRAEGAYDAIRKYYDRVLIYGSHGVYKTAEAYAIPEPRYGIHYCGYVVNQREPQASAETRATLGVGGGTLVFVSAGGGGDSEQLMRTYLYALRALDSQIDFTTLMAVGVNAPRHVMAEMQTLAEGLPVRVISHVADGFNALAAADLVITMAGYNTLAEVLQLGKKCLVVPRAGPSAEQRTRARLFEARNWVRVLDPADLTPATLGDLLIRALGEENPPHALRSVPMCGARIAAELALELLEKKTYAAVV